MMDLYLQMGIALILVSGLILLMGLFMKKRQDKVGLRHIMGYQSLGQKKGIAMVKVGQEVLLVGVTATDIKLLKTVDAALGRSTEPADQPDTSASMFPQSASDALNRLRTIKDSLYAAK
jgi:flagellar biogenesis protein FliO